MAYPYHNPNIIQKIKSRETFITSTIIWYFTFLIDAFDYWVYVDDDLWLLLVYEVITGIWQK